MTRHAGISLLFLYLLLCWLKFPMMLDSCLSLMSGIALILTGPSAIVWEAASALAEFWIALLVWALLGWFLLKRIRHGILLPANKSRGAMFLLGVAIVISLVPFLTPVPPDLQGELMTTRLLPPGSVGVKSSTIEFEVPPEAGPLESLFKTSRARLTGVGMTIRAGGAPGPGEELMIFLLGTDDNGRDVFSRLLAGGRASLLIGGLAAFGSMFVGVAIGVLAGYWGRILDTLLMRLTDLMLSIPGLFLVVGSVAFLGQSVPTLISILVLTGWMGIARTVRAEVIKLKGQEFILAARLLHQPASRILWKHILPNIRPVLVAAAVLQFGNAVLAEASLSFLGLGIQPPTPTWGNMLGEALGYFQTAWWLAVFPGLLLASVLLAAHTVGESGITQP